MSAVYHVMKWISLMLGSVNAIFFLDKNIVVWYNNANIYVRWSSQDSWHFYLDSVYGQISPNDKVHIKLDWFVRIQIYIVITICRISSPWGNNDIGAICPLLAFYDRTVELR